MDHVPVEIIKEILANCDGRSVKNFALTSQHHNLIGQDQHIWKQISERDYGKYINFLGLNMIDWKSFVFMGERIRGRMLQEQLEVAKLLKNPHNTMSSFATVPVEIIKEILKHCDGRSVKNFALTSKHHNVIGQDSHIWEHIFERDYGQYINLFKLYTTDWKSLVLSKEQKKAERLQEYLSRWFDQHLKETLSATTLEFASSDVRFRDFLRNTIDVDETVLQSADNQLSYIDCWLIWILPTHGDWFELYDDVSEEWFDQTDKKLADLFPGSEIEGDEHYSNSSQSVIFRIIV